MNELKKLSERKDEIRAEMKKIQQAYSSEERAATDEEIQRFNALEKELDSITTTQQLEKRAAEIVRESETSAAESAAEERASSADSRNSFNSYIRTYINSGEVRAGDGMTITENGVISTELSRDIIHDVTELSNIIDRISIVNSTGDYKQIVADSANKITVGWAPELSEIMSASAKFKTIEISHHKLASVAKISKELINYNSFDIIGEVTNQFVIDFAMKAEAAIINGTGTDQPTGLTTSGTVYTMGSSTDVTADDIVKIYHKLKAPYQMNSCWIMSSNTLCTVRILKDGNGQYYFHQSDLTSGYAGTLLGKPVYISEAMADAAASAAVILYGDFARAYKANLNPNVSIEVLRETYALQGAYGILGTMFIDGKPVNPEAYVVGKMAKS